MPAPIHEPTESARGFPLVLASARHLWHFEASHANGPRWYLTVLGMGASPVIGDAEHLFLCPVIICTSSLEKCVLKSSAHFYDGYFFILFLHCFPDSFMELCMSFEISFSFFGVIILNYLSGTL